MFRLRTRPYWLRAASSPNARIRSLEVPTEPEPCAVADVQHFHPLLLLGYSIDDAGDMRLVAEQ